MESDCATLNSKVKSKLNAISHIGVVVFYIKSRAPNFISCCFTHVSRSCNMVVHVLAKTVEHDTESCCLMYLLMLSGR